LREVKNGEMIVIWQRNQPIAHIVPIQGASDEDEELASLAARGIIRLGKGQGLGDEFWNMPAPRISEEILKQALDEDRGPR
jgi:antitoxin (DNA-binding transcriptional repressor) of toxin-antitoxin stability system